MKPEVEKEQQVQGKYNNEELGTTYGVKTREKMYSGRYIMFYG